MYDSFYTEIELAELGLKTIGKNVLISRKTSFYSPDLISIGNSVRIDDYCILSGTISLGSYIHISAFSALYGKYGIVMADHSGLSPRCTVLSASDDFSGNFMIGPMVDQKYTNVRGGKVMIGKYCQIGAHSVIFPGVVVDEGVAVGAMSLVNRDLEPWKIYKGIPAVYLKDRSKKILDLNFNE